MMKKILLVILFLYRFSLRSVYSQNNGKLTGKIIDANTDEPLIGVNIILKGTYYGAASDINGKFTIENITPGTYNVRISFIGYKTVEYTGIKIECRENCRIRC